MILKTGIYILFIYFVLFIVVMINFNRTYLNVRLDKEALNGTIMCRMHFKLSNNNDI